MNAFDRAFLGEESEKTTERAAAIQDTAKDTLDEAQGVKEDPFDRVFGAVKEDTPPPKAADKGYSAGQFASDAGRMAGSSFVQSTLQAPKGIEDAAKGVVRDVATGDILDKGPLGVRLFNIARKVFTDAVGLRSLEDQFQDQQQARIATDKAMSGFELDWTKDLAAYGEKVAKDIRENISQEGKDRLAGSTPEGNIFKGELSFGDDPTLSGYALQAAGVLGSLAPTLLTILVTKNPNAAAGVGFGMGAGEASNTAREYVDKVSDAELEQNSPYYKQLIDSGLDKAQARKIISDKAAESGALLQGMVAAVGDRVTGKLLTGAYDNIIGKVLPAGGGVGARTARAAGVGAASAVEEGVQEVTEGVASDLGIRSQVTNKEVGEDSAANLILGAIGGAGPGAVKGFVSGGGRTPTEPSPAQETVGAPQNQQQPQTVDPTVQTVADAQPQETAVAGATPVQDVVETVAQTTVDPELEAAATASFGGESTAKTAGTTVNQPENARLEPTLQINQDQNLSLPAEPTLKEEIEVANAQSQTVEEDAAAPAVTPDRQLQINLGNQGSRFVVFSDPDHKVLFQLGSRIAASMRSGSAKTLDQVRELTTFLERRLNMPAAEVRKFAIDYRDRVISGSRGVDEGGVFSAPMPGTANPIIDDAVQQINQEFKLAPGETVQIQEANADNKMTKIARAIKAAFGTDVVWVNFGPNRTLTTNSGRTFGAINGMRVGGRNAILVDANNPQFLNTIGHELTHILETKYPEIYARLVELARTRVPEKKQQQFRKSLQSAVSAESGGQVDEELFESELVAEMMGEQAVDPQFWIDVFNAAADRTFAQDFVQAIQNIIEKLLTVMQGPQFVKDRKSLIAVRKAATEAFQQWIQQEQNETQATPQTAGQGQGNVATAQTGQDATGGAAQFQRATADAIVSRIADGKPLSPLARKQYPEVARVYDLVSDLINKRAPIVNAKYKQMLDRLAAQTGGRAKMGPIKKIGRAYSKVYFDYGNDPEQLNDVVRATLVLDSVDQIPGAIEQALQMFPGSFVKRNHWEDGAKPLPGGYRDVMFRGVAVDGMRVELQMNVQPMIDAKDVAHKYYKQSEELLRKLNAGLLSPEKAEKAQANVAKLLATQEATYSAAFLEATKSRNASSETDTPSDINVDMPNPVGSAPSQRQGNASTPERNVTGMSSTSKNSVPSGNEVGSATDATPVNTPNGIVNQPDDAVERSSVWLRESDPVQARRAIGLNPEPEQRGDKANRVRQIGEALNALTLRSNGKIEDKDGTDAARDKIAEAMADEIQYHLGQQAKTGTGLGWYSSNFPNAIKRLGKVFPELKKQGGPRDLFTAILAVTSNGEDVLDNTRMAIRVYDQVRNGTPITQVDVGTRRKAALDANFATIAMLLEKHGINGMRRYLLSEMTVSEINSELRSRGEKPNSSYTASMTMPRAALYFGPKLGAFYANLSGAEGYLTMDLWWSRTFNRMRGTLIPQPTATSIDAVRQLLNLSPETSADEVVQAAIPYQESYKAKGYKNGTEVEVKSNTLVKTALLELNESPFRATDREFMYETAKRAQEILAERGTNVSIADIQAALWYYEKRLYSILSGRKADDIGYEEAIDEYIKSDRSERPPARFNRVGLGGAVADGEGAQTGRDVLAQGESDAGQPRARFSRANLEAMAQGAPDAPDGLVLGYVPPVLQAVGVERLPLVITKDKVVKIVNPERFGKATQDRVIAGRSVARRIPLTAAQLYALPTLMADPVAVLKSSERSTTGGKGLVILTSAKVDGYPVIVTLAEKATMTKIDGQDFNEFQVAEITTALPKNQAIPSGGVQMSPLNRDIAENALYFNKERGAQLAQGLRLSLPRLRTGTSKSNVLLPNDIVNRYGENAFQFERQDVEIPRLRGVRFSRASFDLEPNSGKDNFIYLMQDKNIDLKRVQRDIRDAGFQLADQWDAYLQEELFHGRAAKRVKNFIRLELDPLLKEMISADVSMDELDQHLHARHAKEANDQVRSVNPGMPDGGSGMTDKEADDYFNSLPTDKAAALDSLAARVMNITRESRRLMVAYGIETQDTIDQWEQSYQNYVPLFREGIESGSLGIGQGFSVQGSTSKRRMGSQKSVADILANIAMQRERVIARGEKNRVGVALFGLAVQNPNEDFWLPINPDTTFTPGARSAMIQTLVNMGIPPQDADNIAALPQDRVIDPKTGIVTLAPAMGLRNQPNVLTMRINGKDRVILFNMNNERAMRMVASLKNLDTNNLGQATAMMGTAGDYLQKMATGVGTGTRYFASINTQYNPAFGIYNFIRDVFGGTINLSSTPLKNQRLKVLVNSLPALAGIYRDLRLVRDGQVPTSRWSQIFEEFESEGGKTGFRDLFARSDERAKALENELKLIQAGRLKRAGMGILNWLSDFNEAIENAIRLSAYKAARDMGMSGQRSASIAKNLTVNFNRKGAITARASMLYAFFNASVQGTARIGETLTEPDSRKVKLSTAGKTVVLGGVTIGIGQALLLSMAGFGDDDIPEYVKDKSFVIPTGDGKYLAIPMPLGYNVLPAFGRRITEMGLKENVNYPKEILGMFVMISDAFNPLGASSSATQLFAPTVLDPLVALDQNRDNFGRPIAREDFNSLDPTPGWTRGKENASAISTGLAYAINWMTGGTDFTPGKISPTPDQIDYLFGQVFGGVGREAIKISKSIEAAIDGEELATYNIPVVGRLGGNVKEKAVQTGRFYDNIKLLNGHQREIEGRAKNEEDYSEYMEKYPEAQLYKEADKVYRSLSDLRKAKRLAKEEGQDTAEFDDEILRRMVEFNQKVTDLRR